MTIEEALEKICTEGRELLSRPNGADLFCVHTMTCKKCNAVFSAITKGDCKDRERELKSVSDKQSKNIP